jgi:hypothetical protein
VTPGQPGQLFPFTQVELPWALGPSDGRYLLRDAGNPSAAPSHVLVIATLGAAERRRSLVGRRGRSTQAQPQPEPTPVITGRATVVGVARPFADESEAAAWLSHAGEDQLAEDLAVLGSALHAFRVATADPYLNPIRRERLLVARIGYGRGEQVADGLWTEARELIAPIRRQRRARLVEPQARLARLLGAREHPLVCEELALRARVDLDHGRPREAALQVLVALDAAIAELGSDPDAGALEGRIDELRAQRDPVADAAQAALAGPLDEDHRESIEFALERIEAALRARSLEGE